MLRVLEAQVYYPEKVTRRKRTSFEVNACRGLDRLQLSLRLKILLMFRFAQGKCSPCGKGPSAEVEEGFREASLSGAAQALIVWMPG